MQVRLGFSVAANLEPDIFVVDEVLAVGDSQFRQRCTERLAELRRNGTTIVFVSHNLFLVKNICDYGVLLGNGKVQASGDVVDVINAYENWVHEQGVSRRLTGNRDDEDEFVDAAVRIKRVEPYSPGKAGDEEFSYDEPFVIHVHYEAIEPIDDPNLVLHISRSDGTTACMVRTKDYGFDFDRLYGEGTLSVTISPLQLTGGGYTIQAQILNELDVQLARGSSSWFLVAGLGLSSRERGGVYVPNVSCAEILEPREVS
jgi:hypothetical protein